jgi:hypothetical protein
LDARGLTRGWSQHDHVERRYAVRWRGYRNTALTLTLLNVVAVILQFFTFRRGMTYGLANRLVVALMMAWLIATAIRLRTVARDASPS